MNKRFAGIVAGLLLVPCLGTVALGAPDVEAVLKQMPADLPLGAVVVDMEKFDKNIIAYAKSINPKSDFEGMLSDMKKNLGIAPWIDFTKPVGLAQANLQGGEPVLWASIPNFKEKVKTVPDAKEEEGGIWFLPFAEMDDLYAAVKGDMVIAASDKTQLESALKKEGRTLADDLRPRLDLLTNRDVYVHLNFDPVRPMALAGIMQASQMAPMMAMMAAQQGGGDPASMTAVFTGVIDAVKNFVEQGAFVDITLGISATAADATIATGFKDGEIKNYLAKNKPASASLLATFEEQPFTMAMGWQIPGDDSPFLNYLFDKMGSVPAGGAAPAAGEKSAGAEGAEIARDLYRKVEGMNLIVRMSKEGMTSAGDYLGKDVAGIQDLAKKSMIKENPMAAMMTSGISYEVAEGKKLGDKSVDAFTIKIDPANPSADQAKKMLGPNTTLYMGPMDGRVGYFSGPEAEAQKYFTGKVAKPFASGALVAESMKALPAKRNLVILVDPASVLPAFGPLLGMELPENIPPGPPIAISTSLSGDYARTDIHVPAKAIARVMEAVTPAPPM